MTEFFCRRDLLRAVGATLMLPPFLRDAMAAAAELPPRLVLFMWANGTHLDSFWPDANFRSFILDPLLDDPELRPRTTVIQGVRLDAEGNGNEHDRGFHSFWTGVTPVGSYSDSYGGGPSLDQIVRARLPLAALPYPTLNCGVHANVQAPKNGHRTSFSYVGPKQPVPTQIDPYRLYAALFRMRGSGDPMTRLRHKRSVLDFVAEDLRLLRGRLGTEERAKLEIHQTSLRELEGRLTASLTPGQGTSCARPGEPMPGGLDLRADANVPVLTTLMMDLAAAALTCNLTRIVTFQFGYCGNGWRFGWIGINQDSHGAIAHLDLPGGDPKIAEQASRIGRWTTEQVAHFARALHAVPDGSGTALDNSLLVFSNENATGYHSLENLPIAFVGGAGGRLTRPGRMVDVRHPTSRAWGTNHQVATTVTRLMGLEAEGFGNRPACGPLQGVV